jgi:glycosyltransferase involved in cell wall biosynthesis
MKRCAYKFIIFKQVKKFFMQVSALTIIHNRVDLFAETIRSVLAQSHPVHELIVIDDGSVENVKAVTEAFQDPRIKYFHYPRIGVISKLRNIALSKSSGDVMAFIDSDDLWHKDKIGMHVEKMRELDAAMVLSDCQQFNARGLLKPSICEAFKGKDMNVFEQLLEHNQSLAFGTNLFFKKEIDGRAVRFDEKLFVGEHDLLLRISSLHKTVFIGEVLNYIRRHDRNTTVPGHITELLSPLEYNRTLDKLLAEKRITRKTYRQVKAANYSKSGGYYMHRKRYRKSFQYACAAMRLDANAYYFKILLKACWLRLAD